MKKHILSVDDAPAIRNLLQELLAYKGYRVSTVGELEQASKIVKEDPPQLIIMDFQAEESDGFVSIDELKKLAPATPIMLLTGAVFDCEVTRNTIKKKVAGYVAKPASLAKIVGEIRRLLNESQDVVVTCA
ncbi:MAG: response regulator [Verrucomicrobiota bacterium]|jgi:DNA-binding NtrC family response regulator